MASVALRSSRSFSYPTASKSSALALALRVGEADPTGAPKPRLLDRVRVAIRARHYSRRTENFPMNPPAASPCSAAAGYRGRSADEGGMRQPGTSMPAGGDSCLT